jgi:hypothetical protein
MRTPESQRAASSTTPAGRAGNQSSSTRCWATSAASGSRTTSPFVPPTSANPRRQCSPRAAASRSVRASRDHGLAHPKPHHPRPRHDRRRPTTRRHPRPASNAPGVPGVVDVCRVGRGRAGTRRSAPGHHRPHEVPAICREIITEFSKAGMRTAAITALAYLNEALALGKATPRIVRDAQPSLRRVCAERPRVFAPAPRSGRPASTRSDRHSARPAPAWMPITADEGRSSFAQSAAARMSYIVRSVRHCEVSSLIGGRITGCHSIFRLLCVSPAPERSIPCRRPPYPNFSGF